MWPNPQEAADLVTFTEEILNGKLHFLCSLCSSEFLWIPNSERYTPRILYQGPTKHLMVTSRRSLVLYWVVALKKLESLKPQGKLACQNPISVTLDKFTLPRGQNGTPPGTFPKKHSNFFSGTVIWQSTSQRLLIKLFYSSKPSLLSYHCHCFIILTALAVFKTLLGWVYMCVICFGNVTLFFAFPCNAKSFVIWCVFLFLLPYLDLGQTGESAILMFYPLLTVMSVTSTKLIS